MTYWRDQLVQAIIHEYNTRPGDYWGGYPAAARDMLNRNSTHGSEHNYWDPESWFKAIWQRESSGGGYYPLKVTCGVHTYIMRALLNAMGIQTAEYHPFGIHTDTNRGTPPDYHWLFNDHVSTLVFEDGGSRLVEYDSNTGRSYWDTVLNRNAGPHEMVAAWSLGAMRDRFIPYNRDAYPIAWDHQTIGAPPGSMIDGSFWAGAEVLMPDGTWVIFWNEARMNAPPLSGNPEGISGKYVISGNSPGPPLTFRQQVENRAIARGQPFYFQNVGATVA